MRTSDEMLRSSMREISQHLISVIPGACLLRQDGACAIVTGIPAPPLNGVWFERPNPDMAGAVALLDEVSRAGVPFSLKLRPGSDQAFTQLAAANGMRLAEELTFMAVDGDSLAAIREPAGLIIRQLAPEQASRHASVAAAGFGVPRDIFLRAVGPGLLRLGSARCYVGEVNGQPVTTSLSVSLGDFTGIFNVATVADFRGRGFATAMTARAVTDGLAAGSTRCWLEATVAGLPAYRTVGFQAIEPMQYWVSAS